MIPKPSRSGLYRFFVMLTAIVLAVVAISAPVSACDTYFPPLAHCGYTTCSAISTLAAYTSCVACNGAPYCNSLCPTPTPAHCGYTTCTDVSTQAEYTSCVACNGVTYCNALCPTPTPTPMHCGYTTCNDVSTLAAYTSCVACNGAAYCDALCPTPTPTEAPVTTCGKNYAGVEVCCPSAQSYTACQNSPSCGHGCTGCWYNAATPTPTSTPQLPNLTCLGGLCFPNITKILPSLGGAGSNQKSRFSNEPVNLATGNYIYQYQDLYIPGRGLPLAITRSYNSLSPLTGPFGASWTFNYNVKLTGIEGSGTVLVIREDGRTDIYNVSSNGTYTPPLGIFDTLTRNADGSYTLERKDHISYLFTATGLLSTIADTNGNKINLTYTGNNLTQVTDPSGRELTFTYNAAGQIASITDTLGRVLSYSYDADDNLIQYTDPVGGTFAYTYDGNHRMISITNPRGIRIMTNTYNGDGRVISQSNALGAATNFSYDTTNRITTETDPLGRSTRSSYNDNFWETSETNALGNTLSYTYDGNGNRNSATDANGHTTSSTYDANGNILQITDPSGHSTTHTYDSKNNLLSTTDALGRQATFAYDANSNPVHVTDALGNVTTFTYDQYGQVLQAQDANGHGTAHTFDSYGNPVSTTDAAGNTATFTYDLVGRKGSATDARGKTSTLSYDALDRLVSITDPLGHSATTSYDGVGNRISSTDAMGSTTYYAYDPLNNLANVTDTLGGTVSYTYNTVDNLVSMTDANGHTTQYTYDPVNRPTSSTDPLGHITNSSYDAAGNKISITDNNGYITHLTYDALNRLTGVSYHDGTSVGYTYDAVGNRLAMTDGSGTTSYAYDGLNRLTSVTSSGGQLVQYRYDSVGNRIRMTYPDGKTVSYAYDGDNRLSGVTDWTGNTTSYGYDANGNAVNLTYPNGIKTGYSYDNGNRLTNLVNMNGNSVVSSYGYTLDALGNRLQVTETGLNSSSLAITYGYDVLNRLHTVTYPGTTVTYTYDPMGNRQSMATNTGNVSSTITYSYDAGDQLLSAGGTTYTYDNNGNRMEKNESGGISLYGYDGANRLASVSLQGGPLLVFAYDGDGNRLSKSVTTGNTTGLTRYVWDVNTGLPQVLTEADGQGTDLSLYGLQRISMTGPAGGQMYYQYDGLGSVRGLSNSSGTTGTTYSYDAFGKPDLTTGSGENDFLYRAEQQDPETGLIYLRARYYDPSIGRFITRDSFQAEGTLTQGINRYVYTGNNPVNRIDPTGRLFGLDDFGASQLGFLLGEISQYGSDVGGNMGAHKTGLAILNPTSSVEVYSASGAGGAATAVLTVDGAEIGFAVGDVPGAFVGGAAGCYSGVTGTNILKDVVSGKDPDLIQAATNGAIETTTNLGVDRLPVGEVGKGLVNNGLNQFWEEMYSNNKDLFRSQNKAGK